MRRVDVDFRKWGGLPHWRFSGVRLGEDEHGVWVGAGPGTAYTGPRGAGAWAHGFVGVFPHDGWWAAMWWDESYHVELYVDVCTQPVWLADDHVTMIDLDLDVRRGRDGRVELLDEDEFAEHRVKFGYPHDVVAGAQETADRLMRVVVARDEPFGSAPDRWWNELPT